MVGIVGRNGSGKSNFVSAINYCVTGEFERKKDRLISLGETTGSIEVELEINSGLTIVVTRALKGARAELKFSDGRPDITGADAVNEALLTLLDIDKTTLKNIVFVGQDELTALLYSRDSERERLAQQFFGIDRAVRIERILSDRYNRVHVPDIREDSREILKGIQDKVGDQAVSRVLLERKLAEFDAPRLESLKELSTRWQLHASAIEAKARAGDRLDTANRELEETRVKLNTKLAETRQ